MTTSTNFYAIFYKGMYFGTGSHESKTLDIKSARVFTKEEAITFIKNVPGSQAHLINS